MILTERLHIIPLSYYELVSRVYSHTGAVSTNEEEQNVVNYTLKPMKEAPEKDHIFFTFWVGYDKGEEVIEVGFLRPPNDYNGVEIWCHTNPAFINKGYGTEAIIGLVKWANSQPISFVCANVDIDNIASKRMLEKSGFNYVSRANNGMDAYFIKTELFDKLYICNN